LIRRDLDIWQPGEHNGTFRGNNHAFVTATAAINHFWSTQDFGREIARKASILRQRLREIAAMVPGQRLRTKGRGLMQGLECPKGQWASAISRASYLRGLVIETGGPHDEVLKCLCPLTIDDADLEEGLCILSGSVAEVFADASTYDAPAPRARQLS